MNRVELYLYSRHWKTCRLESLFLKIIHESFGITGGEYNYLRSSCRDGFTVRCTLAQFGLFVVLRNKRMGQVDGFVNGIRELNPILVWCGDRIDIDVTSRDT